MESSNRTQNFLLSEDTATTALSGTKQRSLEYPDPFIVPPSSGRHKQSFIVLHGRGSNGELFGSYLLMMAIPSFTKLQAAFPDAKWVFPTASKRRARTLGRSQVNQWFDIKNIKAQTENEDWQFEGLRESFGHVKELLQSEIAEVAAENVVLWGLSQGMAQTMILLLLWEGPRFAVAVGMCGWLPLKARMEREVKEDADLQDEENPFGGADVKASGLSNLQKAGHYLREELDVRSDQDTSERQLDIPVFIGHGTEDPKVPTELSHEARDLLQLLGFNVEFKLYEGLGHWYSPNMLHDIVRFLQHNGITSSTTGAAQSIDL